MNELEKVPSTRGDEEASRIALTQCPILDPTRSGHGFPPYWAISR
jgi:hypothetical protein